jgi:peptide-methionine (S)-S-oxide reductase
MTSKKAYLARGGILVSSALLLGLAGFILQAPARASEAAVVIPAPAADTAAGSASTEKAVLAGGCFWGMQAVFEHVKGVKRVVSGYSGGSVDSPSYEQVTTGTTGHAEAVEIVFDPKEVSYGKLLQVYFSVAHNPTQLNFQGPDYGTQYRSAIYFTSAEQEKVAKAYIDQLTAAKSFPDPIVTEVTPLSVFFPAEDYHQDYYFIHPESAYIQYHDVPKVENLERLFPDLWQSDPARLTEATG